MKLRTEHVFPPIPDRRFDWAAYDEDSYDADCDDTGYFSHSIVGYGRTEADAIDDFWDQWNNQGPAWEELSEAERDRRWDETDMKARIAQELERLHRECQDAANMRPK